MEQTDAEFLTRYRQSCERALASATAEYNLKLLRFDTQKNTTEQIADKVIDALDGLGGSSRVAGS